MSGSADMTNSERLYHLFKKFARELLTVIEQNRFRSTKLMKDVRYQKLLALLIALRNTYFEK